MIAVMQYCIAFLNPSVQYYIAIKQAVLRTSSKYIHMYILYLPLKLTYIAHMKLIANM